MGPLPPPLGHMLDAYEYIANLSVTQVLLCLLLLLPAVCVHLHKHPWYRRPRLLDGSTRRLLRGGEDAVEPECRDICAALNSAPALTDDAEVSLT
jgi:hypothetical protein